MESAKLEYGKIVMDLSKAKEFLGTADENVVSHPTDFEMEPIIVDHNHDLHGNQFIFKLERKRFPIEGVKTKPNFKGIADSIKTQTDLICQIEYSTRGILPHDTKKEIAKILDYIQYYNDWIILKDVDIRTMNYRCDKKMDELTVNFTTDQTLSFNFPMICAAYVFNCHSTVGINVDANTIAIMLVFKKIFMENGCLNFHVFFDPEIGVSNIFDGTSVFVYQNSDLDSAVDSILNGAWLNIMSYWRINHICVHESIYKLFVEKLSKKISMLRWNLPANYKPSDYISKARESAEILLNTATENGIEVITSNEAENYIKPLIILDNLQWFKKHFKANIPMVLLQSFRTTKEAISLAKTLDSQCFSIWCDKNSTANELALAISASCIWINGFGHYSSCLNLEYRGERKKIFRGGISVLLYTTLNVIRSETFTDKNRNLKNSIDNLQKSFEQWRTSTSEYKAAIFLKIVQFLKNDPSIDRNFLQASLKNASDCKNMRNESLMIKKSLSCMEINEPAGIFVVKSIADTRDTIFFVFTILEYGNGVILLDENPENKKVWELLAKHGLPIFVLNSSKIFDIKYYDAINGIITVEHNKFTFDYTHYAVEVPHLSEYYKMFFTNRKLLWNIHGETFSN